MASDLSKSLGERAWAREPVPVDLGRMRRERHARLQAAMADQGVEVAVLLHGPHVAYATGRPVTGADVTQVVVRRPVAVVVAGHDRPHLFEPDPVVAEAVAAGGDVEVHPGAAVELDEGVAALGRALAAVAGPLAGRRVAVDAQTGAMLRAGVPAGPAAPDAGAAGEAAPADGVGDAASVVAAAKIVKTADELACIDRAQRANEEAMAATRRALRPGATRADVAGVFLAELARLGAGANLIDPIFQPMPRTVAAGPRTTTGDVAFPTGVGNPTFGEGDVVWVDTGIDHLGYASDFGRTWIVGRDPDAAERELFARWCAVMAAVLDTLAPGATGGDLCRAAEAAAGGERPWLPHFYLAHGVGVESAEMPLVGTDLGPPFDDRLVLAPGMVLVLEPAVWEDGAGGYRAEEVVTVTDDGWAHLGGNCGYGEFGP